MSESARRNVILASNSITQPGELDRLNVILEDAGLGRPLGSPKQLTRTTAVVPVSAKANTRAVVAKLREAAPESGSRQPSPYDVHTVNDVPPAEQSKVLVPTNLLPAKALKRPVTEEDLPAVTKEAIQLLHFGVKTAAGAKTGHGTVAWTPATERDMRRDPSRLPTSSSPVVMVLDSGVKPHAWLPPQDLEAPQDTDFWFMPAVGPSFTPPIEQDPRFDPRLTDRMFGAYWGHATFLAGLIRLAAPDARVMSVKLMDDHGKLNDFDVVTALEWLAGYCQSGHRVDVVLMSFGRPKEPGEANPDDLVAAVKKLAELDVQLVASAGNDHSHTEELPACLAMDPELPVVSVGAGTSAADHEPYSNHGPWVREWRPGTVVSIMPLTVQDGNGNGYARWSGTSFSAAIVAGELAQARAAKPAVGGGS